MKSFRFLGLLVAVGLLSACSDNLDENQGNGPGSGDKTPAYLSISIANNGNSTKANTGDGQGDAEDSGLENAGTTNENKIASILLVALSEDGTSGYAKLYATSGESVNGWTKGPDANTYTSEPIKLGVGTYKILVVANPYAGFVSGFTEATDLTTVKGLYDKIRDGKYVPDGSTINTADAAAGVLATADNGVMMANQKEVSQELKEENTPDNPAEVEVEIERTVSKITFREREAEKGGNVYKVPVAGQVKAKIEVGDTSDGEEDVTLNVAKDACTPTPNTVYVLIKEDPDGSNRTVTVYGAPNASSEGKYRKLEAKKQDDYNAGTADEKKSWYVVADVSNVEASLTYQFDGTGTTDWYVRLEGYALVNLSKEVYHVRHIQDAHGVPAPFGTLNGNNFLITPYWDDKNGVEFDGDGNFLNNPPTTTWFYNTLAQVSEESEKLTIDSDGNFETDTDVDASYFKSWPTTGEETPGEVTPGEDNPKVGVRLAYCFENSTDIEHQKRGLSTGITFVARMYKDEACQTPVDQLYQYNGYNFESLAAIGEAFRGNTPGKILALIAKETAGTEITKEELKEAKVVKYVGNICYYYSTQIKHYDNGNNNTLGNMEFAIMRNNIYSLAVTNITRLGDPIVDPTPETPNETKEAALKVEVKILPWIVRYNNIEF